MFQHLMERSPRIVVLACYSYQYYQQGCYQQPSVEFHFLVVIEFLYKPHRYVKLFQNKTKNHDECWYGYIMEHAAARTATVLHNS